MILHEYTHSADLSPIHADQYLSLRHIGRGRQKKPFVDLIHVRLIPLKPVQQPVYQKTQSGIFLSEAGHKGQRFCT